MDESQVRAALFVWLETESAKNGGIFTWRQLRYGFSFQGEQIALIGMPGIWKPRQFEKIPISIRTSEDGPYEDTMTPDGVITYYYRGTNASHSQNEGLRLARVEQTPLVYFVKLADGEYQALWPIFVVDDHRESLTITAQIGVSYALGNDQESAFKVSEPDARRYVAAMSLRRMHQDAFRRKVIRAYDENCTVCRLKHPDLLDAAHIIKDRGPLGKPVVPNGLSLCKIHHGAYDANIIGITPDYIIKVRDDVLEEHDGPMLRHGLQELHGQEIKLPSRKADWPDRERLEVRWGEFGRTG